MTYCRLLLAALILVATPAVTAESTTRLVAREAPIPAGVSEALRASLKAFPPSATNSRPAPPDSAEAWRALQQQRDEARGANSERLLDNSSVTAERKVIGGVPVAWLTPDDVARRHAGRVFLYLHGGAYVFGSDAAGWLEAILIANRLGIRVLSVDYRMPPDFSFPAAVDDVVAVYRILLEQYSAGSIVMGGTSAGGGLALAAAHRFRQLDLPMPGAIYAGTPWADLSKTGDTLFTNEGLDRVLGSYDGMLAAAVSLYANGQDLKQPLLSPVYGDFSGFPPTMLVSGTRDLFLSDVVRTHRKMRAASVIADLHVFEAMSHADYLVAIDAPESLDMYRELERFVDAHLTAD